MDPLLDIFGGLSGQPGIENRGHSSMENFGSFGIRERKLKSPIGKLCFLREMEKEDRGTSLAIF
jgi:hypothetical protein